MGKPKMVRVAKLRKAYCRAPQCSKHTKHKVSIYKQNKGKGRGRVAAQGNRRYDRKQSGFGGQTKPKPHPSAKLHPNAKKGVLRLKCLECSMTILQCIKRCNIKKMQLKTT